MKILKYNLLALLCVFNFYSCNMSDGVENLSGGYQFAQEGENDNSISNNYNDIPANVIGYNFNSEFIIVEQIPIRESYKASIASKLRTDFIIHYNEVQNKTLPSDRILERTDATIQKDKDLFNILKQKGMSSQNSSKDLKISWAVADSIMNTDPHYIKLFSMKYAYWIISLNTDELIGPLTKEEYQQKRKVLGVPGNLQIRPTDD